MNNLVSVENLTIGPFRKFNISIPLNSLTIITGSNNSGKSLLLKVIAGLINNKKVIYDKNIISNYKDIAYMNNFCFNCDSVLNNIRYPLECLGFDDLKIKKIVKDISKDLKISKILNNKIDDLNYYEMLRVYLATILVNSPKLLLLDDPGLYLSPLEKEEFMGILEQIRSTGVTIILSTSCLDEVIYTINSTLYILDDGNIVSSGDMLKVLNDDSLLNKLGLNLPFMIDLSVKLKYYNLVSKINMSPLGMVDSLWK